MQFDGTLRELLALTPFAPFAPPAQFDPQVTVQPEFLPGSEEQKIEDWINTRGWDWHLVRLERDDRLMLMCRRSDPHEMTMCIMPILQESGGTRVP